MYITCTTVDLLFLYFYKNKNASVFGATIATLARTTWYANVYTHVAVVRVHVWRTLCSVCATGARVAQSFPSNS